MAEYINGSKLSQVESSLHDEVVHDFLSIGVTVLRAPQKIGKTFFYLQLSNAIAEGNIFLNHDVEQGRVVYCALEDTKIKSKRDMNCLDLKQAQILILSSLKILVILI